MLWIWRGSLQNVVMSSPSAGSWMTQWPSSRVTQNLNCLLFLPLLAFARISFNKRNAKPAMCSDHCWCCVISSILHPILKTINTNLYSALMLFICTTHRNEMSGLITKAIISLPFTQRTMQCECECRRCNMHIAMVGWAHNAPLRLFYALIKFLFMISCTS